MVSERESGSLSRTIHLAIASVMSTYPNATIDDAVRIAQSHGMIDLTVGDFILTQTPLIKKPCVSWTEWTLALVKNLGGSATRADIVRTHRKQYGIQQQDAARIGSAINRLVTCGRLTREGKNGNSVYCITNAA